MKTQVAINTKEGLIEIHSESISILIKESCNDIPINLEKETLKSNENANEIFIIELKTQLIEKDMIVDSQIEEIRSLQEELRVETELKKSYRIEAEELKKLKNKECSTCDFTVAMKKHSELENTIESQLHDIVNKDFKIIELEKHLKEA